MGMITVTTSGSFGNKTESFSAMKNGHADAVAQAIEFLASELLPKATAQDHTLHDEGHMPENGFRRLSTTIQT